MKSPVLTQRSPIGVIPFGVNLVTWIVAKSYQQEKGWQHVLIRGIWVAQDLMLDCTLSIEFCPNYTNQRVILHTGIP